MLLGSYETAQTGLLYLLLPSKWEGGGKAKERIRNAERKRKKKHCARWYQGTSSLSSKSHVPKRPGKKEKKKE